MNNFALATLIAVSFFCDTFEMRLCCLIIKESTQTFNRCFKTMAFRQYIATGGFYTYLDLRPLESEVVLGVRVCVSVEARAEEE